MTAATTDRPCRGGHLTYVFRTRLKAFQAWASISLVYVTLTQASGVPSIATVDGPLSLIDARHPTGAICWETRGLHERDCFHGEPLTEETYPLTLEMLERASSRYTTTDLGIHRAFQWARRRGVLKVTVVGGSVTYGHGCVSPGGLTDVECAWPNRLQQWFDERINDFKVEVINAARPKYNIGDFLHNDLHNTFPVDVEVDLIIVDYGVNDAVLQRFDFDINNVKLAHEVFISHIRNSMTHMPAIIYAESFISAARIRDAKQQRGNMAEVHAAVTSKYDIPMVSFRDAVWPDLKDPSLADNLWGSEVHASWQEHGHLSEPSPGDNALSLFETRMGCLADERSFVLDASAFVGLPPPKELVESSGWSFSEDTRGDSGLIGFGNSSRSAIISFDLPCRGRKQVLDIGYLKSYSGMGAVKVVVGGANENADNDTGNGWNSSTVVVVDGLWETQASVPGYEVISIPSNLGTIRVTLEVLSAKTEAYHSVFLTHFAGNESDSVRLDRKFKVERMQCC